MTIKPSDLPRGSGIAKMAVVNRDHEKRIEREERMFDNSKDQVTVLFTHFLDTATDSHEAAATLALATVMNLEEEQEVY